MPVDERDTMFSRMSLSPGSKNYEDYYSRNPEKRDTDDLLRSLPELGANESPTFDHMGSPVTDSLFRFLADLRPLSEGCPSSSLHENDPAKLTRWAKGLALYLGADDAGFASMKPEFWYTHRGRQEETYGIQVEEDHPFAVAIISAMDPEMIHKGPLAPEMTESARGYIKSGVAAIALAYAIREMGYRARAHTDGNYLVVASRVAVEAGLGVFGRNGLLIHRRFGPCARISVVTTEMPIIPDHGDPAVEAVRGFCEICGRCADFCPGKAIPSKAASFRVQNPWFLNPERCYATWRRMGTDCGVCISVCPFTEGLDWKELEESQGRSEILEKILLRYGGSEMPRPFDSDPPQWWR
ncbi:MAG: reductive dehalogenase domain-containing protein [Thermovirga sp.]